MKKQKRKTAASKRRRNPKDLPGGKEQRRLYEFYYRDDRGREKKNYFYAHDNDDAIRYMREKLEPAHGHVHALHQVIIDSRVTMPTVYDSPKPVRRENPRAVSSNPKVRQAIELYRKFREADPKRIGMVPIKIPSAAMAIGELDGVLYTTTHGGKVVRYIHNFAKHAKPVLASSSDGKQLLVLGGKYDFTKDGIVDRR